MTVNLLCRGRWRKRRIFEGIWQELEEDMNFGKRKLFGRFRALNKRLELATAFRVQMQGKNLELLKPGVVGSDNETID
jgi:hypothetical protein